MRTEQISVYKFNELSDEAKETAIERFKELDYEWWDAAYEDFKTIGTLMGIDIDNIYFSHMYCQGSGACFEGTYSYKKGSVKALKEYAPQDETLHGIVEGLYSVQRKAFYSLEAKVKQRGHYNHANCTDIDVTDNRLDYYEAASQDNEEAISEFLRDFMNWMMKRLYAEYEYLTSEEAIIETINCNDYEFDEDGNLY